MLWFFSKGSAQLRVLTSRDPATSEYVVELERPERAPEVHRFPDQQSCEVYLGTLERELTAEEWLPDGVRLTGHSADERSFLN